MDLWAPWPMLMSCFEPLSPATSNFERTANLAETLKFREEALANDSRLRPGSPAGDDSHRYVALMRKRLDEVDVSDTDLVRVRERITRSLREHSLSDPCAELIRK